MKVIITDKDADGEEKRITDFVGAKKVVISNNECLIIGDFGLVYAKIPYKENIEITEETNV
jgi:hypothetical protein